MSRCIGTQKHETQYCHENYAMHLETQMCNETSLLIPDLKYVKYTTLVQHTTM